MGTPTEEEGCDDRAAQDHLKQAEGEVRQAEADVHRA